MRELTSREKARVAVEAALERKAESPVLLDVAELVSFADVFVLLTGRSDRQVRAIAEAIEQALKQRGEKPLGVEGTDDGRWVLIDLADVIVHVFQADVREHYDLERLWRDAPQIDPGLPEGDLQRGAR